MDNLLSKLEAILIKDPRLMVDGKLLRNKVIELSYKLDAQLLELLMSDPTIEKYFFTQVNGTKIFDSRKFQEIQA